MATLRANYQYDLQVLYAKLEARERIANYADRAEVTQEDLLEIIHILKAMLRNFDRLVANE